MKKAKDYIMDDYIKIISKEEIDETANKLAGWSDFPETTDLSFRLGVNFAQRKFTEIIPDFLNWILENRFEDFGKSKKSSKELFEEYKEYLNE